jgi:hypothetical protein
MTPQPKPAPREKRAPRPIKRTAIKARKQRIRKPKPLKTGWLKRVADEVYSLWVRSRRVCEVCGKPGSVPELQWSHGWSRTWLAIRYHELNSVSSCAPCHVFYTHRPEAWFCWLQDRLGMERWQMLRDIAATHARPVFAGVIEAKWSLPETQSALSECSEEKRKRLTREVSKVLDGKASTADILPS